MGKHNDVAGNAQMDLEDHMDHTFDGALNYCNVAWCVHYVEPWDRDQDKDTQDIIVMANMRYLLPTVTHLKLVKD